MNKMWDQIDAILAVNIMCARTHLHAGFVSFFGYSQLLNASRFSGRSALPFSLLFDISFVSLLTLYSAFDSDELWQFGLYGTVLWMLFYFGCFNCFLVIFINNLNLIIL